MVKPYVIMRHLNLNKDLNFYLDRGYNLIHENQLELKSDKITLDDIIEHSFDFFPTFAGQIPKFAEGRENEYEAFWTNFYE